MAKLSDIIEQLIKDMIDENEGVAEITRGELANKVNCVPSQITYVLSTRFPTRRSSDLCHLWRVGEAAVDGFGFGELIASMMQLPMSCTC